MTFIRHTKESVFVSSCVLVSLTCVVLIEIDLVLSYDIDDHVYGYNVRVQPNLGPTKDPRRGPHPFGKMLPSSDQ